MARPDKDNPKDVEKALKDLGTRCPKCGSLQTVDLNKSGSRKECMSCGNKYDV